VQVRKHSWLWGRLLILVLTGVAISLVFHNLNLQALAQTFHRLHWGWFLGAIALYGALFLPASLRWHVVLRLTGQSVPPAATARLTLIGHFFYTILLGVFGGDTAKSAVFARWYRVPLTDVLATVSLDRLLGSVGMLLFGAIVLFTAAAMGAFKHVQGILFHLPRGWAIGLMVLVAALWIVCRWLPSVASAWDRFIDAFRSGAKILLKSPLAATTCVFCAVLMQMAMSAALAFNLRAATNASLPWAQLLWTFPVVVAIGALPLTFAGLGAREGAALALFGLYGVSREDAVGASLLMVATNLLWAVAGGLLYWCEVRWRRRRVTTTPKPICMLPTLQYESSLSETFADPAPYELSSEGTAGTLKRQS
jgi:uncharacterized membrane protein YbhN (UPF0104 family)